jgi:hypothetical protein
MFGHATGCKENGMNVARHAGRIYPQIAPHRYPAGFIVFAQNLAGCGSLICIANTIMIKQVGNCARAAITIKTAHLRAIKEESVSRSIRIATSLSFYVAFVADGAGATPF